MIVPVFQCEGLFTSTFLVLARIYRGSCNLLQNNISGVNKRSPTSGTLFKAFFAASTDVVSVFTHFDWRCHVLLTDRTLQFLQEFPVKLPAGHFLRCALDLGCHTSSTETKTELINCRYINTQTC